MTKSSTTKQTTATKIQTEPEQTEDLLIGEEKIKQWNKKVDALKKSGKRVAIFGHNNGDPDSFACLMTLQYYFDQLGIEADIFSGGSTGHPMNTTMIKELKLEIKSSFPAENLDKYGLLVVCDSMPHRTLLAGLVADIVLDHHEDPSIFDNGTLFIHERLGSCSTIIYFLLKELGVEIPEDVATALALGISSDTKDFSSDIETEEWDKIAHKELRGIYDYSLFQKINKWYTITDGHLSLLGEAYANRKYLAGNDVLLMGIVDVSEGQTAYLSHIVDTAMRTGIKVAIIIAFEGGQCVQVKVREKSNLMINDFCKSVFEDDEYESDSNRAFAGGRIGSGGGKIPFTARERGVWESIEKISDENKRRKEKVDFFNLLFHYYMRKIEKYIEKNGI